MIGTFLSGMVMQAQDNANLLQWTAESRKIGEGRFEILFKTPGAVGWQLFSPDQVISDIRMAELVFPDSSIQLEGQIKPVTNVIHTNSPVFGEVKVQEGPAEWKATVTIAGQVPARLQGSLQFYYGKGEDFVTATPFEFQVALEGGKSRDFAMKVESIDMKNPVSDCGDDGTENKSLLTIFLLGLGGGLIALLTPCVFPMIPVTVTFFTKKSQDRKKGVFNAVLYGLFIFLIYVLITIPFHVAGNTNPEIFNNISTNVWLNLIFFAIFVTFALSFFGLFEIGLPSSLANKADSKSGLGNIVGIFFMATTLAIVSFSCTGPILGTLLVGVANQGAWPLTVGAAGFGIALGLPFALFALFPHWLQSLPRSGGWMTDVKVVLGFVEVALAIKFLSNADLVQQWGIIKREIFIGSWALISLLIVLYLTGILKIGHSSPVKKFGITRLVFIGLFSAITLYLIPGVTNTRYANLKWISGFPPPLCYSIYAQPVNCSQGFHPLENDYELALERARAENKPILIDFTGWACVNCRKMEETIWPDPAVQALMRDSFIVVSLYVDERRNLPLTEQMVYVDSADKENIKEKPIVTVGDKWATFQSVNFGATSQPQYIMLSPDQRVLAKAKYFKPSLTPAEFEEWLKCGLAAGKGGK